MLFHRRGFCGLARLFVTFGGSGGMVLSVASYYRSMLFHRRGFCGLARPHVTFGGSGGIMTTARPELPYPCSN